MASRVTRSRSRQAKESPVRESDTVAPHPTSSSARILPQPNSLPCVSTVLRGRDFKLLQLKQQKLATPSGPITTFIQEHQSKTSTRSQAVKPDSATLLAQAAAATLVFAQEEAGTAVCISPVGLLLTCSHCVAESQEEFDKGREKWLLFASGQAVRAKCVAWDPGRDLALLKITAAQAFGSRPDHDTATSTGAKSNEFPSITIADAESKRKTPLLCIGHPGSEDLEAATRGIPTDYDVLHISYGLHRGLAAEQDPQDNSEIGALMHDCWTYWGHSGAPLIGQRSGKLVGLHSSWDDQTAMRRGVPLVAIAEFLKEHWEINADI